MQKTALKRISKPQKMQVTRIEEIFENTNPYMIPEEIEKKNIIKNYIYSNQKVFLSQ